jgi:O-antigen/teichoic acid export membrane protein
MMASVLALGLQFGLVKHQVSRLLESVPTQEGIQAFTRKLSPLVRKFYPNALFTSVQGQLSIWLISFFASTSEVADFGALTRFAILFAMVGAPISQWLVPAFARAETPRRMALLLTGSAALVSTMTVGLLVAAWLAPDWLLWLLGPAYAQLQQELLWVLGVLGINSLMQTLWGFNMSRGWINTISLNIPLVLATQLITLCFVPVNTLSGVALLGIIVALVQCVHATWIAVSQLRKLSLSSPSPSPCP